jgi:PAS domain S-box-containing protein
MEATLSKLVTLLSSIAHQLAERVRAVARIASRERPADPDVARLFELPLDLMGVASIDGTILRVNPGFERVLGLAPEEILGRRLVEIVHPDDREATAAVFAGVLESGELSVFENRLPAADGSHRWLEWNVLADADEGLVYEPQPFPAQAERRVSQFTELVATGIANAEARAEVQRLADEQAALRRVATLVAEGAAPAEVFNAVIGEVAQLVGAAQVGLMRSESSHEISILAQRGQDPAVIRPGMRLPLDGDSVTARVLRTERSARINLYDEPGGTIADIAHRSNVNATVGAPITVEGALWGVITASWEGQDLPPVDAEERLAEFAELLDTAIANADSRDQLTASRARVLTAGDEARRRVVRDLHDGGQQRLVHTIVTLKLAQRALSEDRERTGVAPRRGARSRGAGQHRASRAGPRDPPGGPHARRSAGRRRRPRFAPRPSGRGGRHQHAPAAGNRGERVLHRGRGADQCGQALARCEGTGDRCNRRRHAEHRGTRRRHRGSRPRRSRAARNRRPRGRTRRATAHRTVRQAEARSWPRNCPSRTSTVAGR